MSNQKPNLSNVVRNNIAQYLYANCKVDEASCQEEFRPKFGTFKAAALKFNVSTRTLHTIWNEAAQQMSFGLPISLRNKKVGLIRPKRLFFDATKLEALKIKRRSTIRGVGIGLEISASTAHRWYKEGKFRVHTNAIKPIMSAANMIERVEYSVNALEVDQSDKKIKFKAMEHIIHLDEKWFYLTKDTVRAYMGNEEADPHRTIQNKKYIPKVMFLCCVSRPIYSEEGTCIFDGKIGMWPFTHQVPAKRRSRNREAGTLETRAVTSITREVIKACIIERVVPAIKAVWPLTENGAIFIQQDNARPHIQDDDPDFRAVASADGFDIHLVFQPPHSPDLNINDLGWFRSLQTLQHEQNANTVDELVAAVKVSFENLSHVKLNKVFLSLQCVMIEILKVKGQNNYKLPHMSKDALIRQGLLPTNLIVDFHLVKECVEFLLAAGKGGKIGPLIEDLDSIPQVNI